MYPIQNFIEIYNIRRCIFIVGYREHTAPLFMESKIMTIYQLNYYMVCICMYTYHHSQLPVIFDNMFITNDNIYIIYLLY